MSKPSRRRIYAVLACLAMLMHLLGMPALASASAEAKLAYGIGGHCLSATASVAGTEQADLHHHHLDPLGSTFLSQADREAQPTFAVDPASPCCCAAAQLGIALLSVPADTLLTIPAAARPPAADVRFKTPRQIWPAIHPRAPPVQARLV